MYGMVFVYNNKVVYSERLPYNPEIPNKIWFHIDNKPREPNYLVLTPDNSIVTGSRKETDNVNFYEIKPLKNE